MKIRLISIMAVAAIAATAGQPIERLELLDGEVLENARIKRADDDGATIFHAGGIVTIAWTNMPQSVVESNEVARAYIDRIERAAREERAEELRQIEKEREQKMRRKEKERELRARRNDPERQEKIKGLFSFWDGSCYRLKKLVKETMHDPKSFSHVKTVYRDAGSDVITVTMTFRGNNMLGGKVVNTVSALVDIYGDGIAIIGNEL